MKIYTPTFVTLSSMVICHATAVVTGGDTEQVPWGRAADAVQESLQSEFVTSTQFPEYQLRLTEPTICDPSVKQYSGYLDITTGKHLFFWFFEARRSPEKAPLTLWLNGGPGCSSMTGLLFELGPCKIADKGHNTTFNPYSWNIHSNMIFLDQPVNVGYSYSDDGSRVDNTLDSAEDVYAFLQLFFKRHPQYAATPFHLAAESYGGTYAPHMASAIHRHNDELRLARVPLDTTHINLASVILANGDTDPYTQFPILPEYLCEGPYPVLHGKDCDAMRDIARTCQRLIGMCYAIDSPFVCGPAQSYCFKELYEFPPLERLGLNPYDVRKKCDPEENGDHCYEEILWVDTWLNDFQVKRALGVPQQLHFESCSLEVNEGFMRRGDGMRNSAAPLPELVDAGVRLLVYAGNADLGCNFMGNEAWLAKLPNRYHQEFAASKSEKWAILTSGRVAGEVRTAGSNGFDAGNVTFVQVYEAGHMAPYDQPEAAFDLFTRWIMNLPLTVSV
ncbi:Serine carboxypeptidase [Phanerochaete sordida]|uniref:Carboxypeptidase n=1 Tax=Phanerochaete sordida TaxID=48140 RepID=A0A9P3GLU4_9APHY|nr:Serine carboxypeptidase [Phanerochaete sordida]